MKMVDNHLRMVFMYHQAKHDGRILPYFDFGKKKGVWRHFGKFKSKKGKGGEGTWKINAETKKQRDSCNKDVPDMSVRQI